MASSALSESPASVSAVVEMVQGELDTLLQRREEIRERIQNLHQVIHGLKRIGGAPAASDTAVDDHATGEWQSLARVNASHSHPALRRACRIALLEGQEAASVTEIYSRIVRRGSFPFDSVRLAHPLLARTLNIMTEEGEITCFKGVTPCRWQRIYPSAEV
jgi:hypothetical protein